MPHPSHSFHPLRRMSSRLSLAVFIFRVLSLWPPGPHRPTERCCVLVVGNLIELLQKVYHVHTVYITFE